MTKSNATRLISMLLVACTVLGCFCGCSAKEIADELIKGIQNSGVSESETDTGIRAFSSESAAACDFALRLLCKSEKSGENTLISPLSVMCALAMTANGAEGETLEQMESVLGMKTDDLNSFISAYLDSLPEGEKYKLRSANSIWYSKNADFRLNEDFLKTNEVFYGADIFDAPFNDATIKDVNDWVSKKTDGAIPEMLDRVSDMDVMYLINALAFEAEWAVAYTESQVRDGEFTNADGRAKTVEFMYSTEYKYLENKNATGFVKTFSGGKYAFVALLPKKETSVSDLLASLDGESLSKLLSSPMDKKVHTSLPRFETEYEAEMAETLIAMGMPRAFDFEDAQFGRIGTSANRTLYISRVLHKTYITVGAQGAKAGAATSVIMAPTSSPPSIFEEKPKEVYLDRPFVYMLIDCERNIPFFIGTVNDLLEE